MECRDNHPEHAIIGVTDLKREYKLKEDDLKGLRTVSEPKPAFLGGPDKRWYLVKEVKVRKEKVVKEVEAEKAKKEKEKERQKKEKETAKAEKEKEKKEKQKRLEEERKLKREEKDKTAGKKGLGGKMDKEGSKRAGNRGGNAAGVLTEKKSGKRKIAAEKEKLEEAEMPKKRTRRSLQA